MGDVYLNGTPRSRIRLRITKGGRKGDVFLPDALLPKLKQFWSYKRRGGESLNPEAPLFCNQTGQRISKRRVQVTFRSWQIKADFDRLYPFHVLCHRLAKLPGFCHISGLYRVALITGVQLRG